MSLYRYLTARRPLAPLSAAVSSTLDFARWAAALLVLLYHVRINVLAEPRTNPAFYGSAFGKALYLVTMAGPQAVMCFFAISGFLVGGSVAAQVREDKFTFAHYALNRATRLYVVLLPALLIGLALDSIRIMKFGMSGPPSAGGEFSGSYTLRTLLGNLFFLQDLGIPTLGSNNPLWSISDEAWYYVLFPLLLTPFMTRRPRAQRGALFVCALSVLAALFQANRELVMLFAVWLIGFGIRLVPFRILTSIGMAWLLAGAAILWYPLYKHHVPGTFFFPTLAFANVLLTAMHEKVPPRPRLAAVNAKLAGFSFSLYLLHAPMLHFLLSMLFGRSNPRLGLPVNWYSCGLALALVLGLGVYAWGFSLLTERKTDGIRLWLMRAAGVLGWPTEVKEKNDIR